MKRMERNDDFQKRAFELWMAVTMFMSTYAKESNGVVKNVSAMLPYATDLQNFWSAYQNASSNDLIRRLHTKIRARLKLMKDSLDASIDACNGDQKLLDKYSENQGYIERKLNELQSLVPREPRHVAEPEQMTLDFEAGVVGKPATVEKEEKRTDAVDDGSDRFLKCLNEFRIAVDGFVSSYSGCDNSVVGYVRGLSDYARTLDSLWRRRLRENGNPQVLDGICMSIRKCISSMRSQCGMSILICDAVKEKDKYGGNHDYLMKKFEALERSCKL